MFKNGDRVKVKKSERWRYFMMGNYICIVHDKILDDYFVIEEDTGIHWLVHGDDLELV